MCIAIFKPKKAHITRKQLLNCWTNNPDGMGVMWIAGNEIQVYKEMNSFRAFYKTIRSVDADLVIHFRIATSGQINTKNCHPFKINNQLGFVHNGVITKMNAKEGDDRSDTMLFRDRVLKQIEPELIYNPAVQTMLSDYIGYSKLIFLDAKNMRYLILNEQLGHWKDGIWFSNKSYEPTVTRSWTCSTRGHGSGLEAYDNGLPAPRARWGWERGKQYKEQLIYGRWVRTYISQDLCTTCGQWLTEFEKTNNDGLCSVCWMRKEQMNEQPVQA